MSSKNGISVSGGLRTESESVEGRKNTELFENSPYGYEVSLENFPKYVKRQNLTRIFALYELFKLILETKGSVVECGVNHGFGIMSWAKISSILEPLNLTRRIYGFDTFEGFPSISDEDLSKSSSHVSVGDLNANTEAELLQLIDIYDSTRSLGHVSKVGLIKGDAVQTIPKFVDENPHLVVSLLFLDFDLYEPTKVALQTFVPRMPKGAVIAFDELDNPLWPGETLAMLEYFSERPLRLKRLPFDPYISYAILD